MGEKEILICDEERMNKVKVQIHPYSKNLEHVISFNIKPKLMVRPRLKQEYDVLQNLAMKL